MPERDCHPACGAQVLCIVRLLSDRFNEIRIRLGIIDSALGELSELVSRLRGARLVLSERPFKQTLSRAAVTTGERLPRSINLDRGHRRSELLQTLARVRENF